MEGLILGIDLCDDYCKVSGIRPTDLEPKDIGFPQADGRTMIQTTLGKKRDVNEWLMGREAYETALMGDGVIIDKLLSRLETGQQVQIGQMVYSAKEMMTVFLGRMLEAAYRELGQNTVRKLVISIRRVTVDVMEALFACAKELGLERSQVRVISHTEAFLYYVLSQKKDYWANESILFDWSGNELHYYEMNVARGGRPHVVHVTHKVLETDFSCENVNEERRQKVADNLLCAHAERLMNRKIISSVLLSGKGLENCQSWGSKAFLQKVCTRRRVYVEASVFSRGGVVIGADDLARTTAFPYTIICEGRIQASIKIETGRRTEPEVTLAHKGSCWYDVYSVNDFILDESDSIEIKVELSKGKLSRSVNIPLDNFPKRPPRTTRVRIILKFVSENEAAIQIIDQGFGDLFPATGAVKRSKIMLQ